MHTLQPLKAKHSQDRYRKRSRASQQSEAATEGEDAATPHSSLAYSKIKSEEFGAPEIETMQNSSAER